MDRVTSDRHRSDICEELGYHPSDLLQANCIIWVEGPSDRIYLNWWIRSMFPNLIEGIHYSIMFYGGRLASHLSNSWDSNSIDDFISLRRLNRRGVILMDSDKDSSRKHINATKRRLAIEFNAGPGHAWITEGREIENYIDQSQLEAAIQAIHPNLERKSISDVKFGALTKLLSTSGKEITASKVEIAKHIANSFQPVLDVLDLRKRLIELHEFIASSSPNVD